MSNTEVTHLAKMTTAFKTIWMTGIAAIKGLTKSEYPVTSFTEGWLILLAGSPVSLVYSQFI